MNVYLYNTTSEAHAVDKTLSELMVLSGTLRESSSIIDPVFNLTDIDSVIDTLNYAYIPEFGRYYFVQNIESVRTGVWRVYMHVDVLYTYRSEILANSAIIQRNENQYDLKLNDGLFKTQQNPRIAQFPFPAGFNQWDFVLAVAGN